jgi:nucleoside-diphosphate-sugar epimerase
VSKALITGGLGFIGHHLARRLLDEGYEVHVLDNAERGKIDGEVEALRRDNRYHLTIGSVTGDAPLEKLGDGFTHVFHLAAIVGVRNVVGQPYRVLSDSAVALGRILEWSRAQCFLQRFVYPSTSEIYAGTLEHFDLPIPTPEATPLTVTDLGRPRTAYMLSKIHGEAMCRNAGVPFTIVRPHNVYGPRMGAAHVIPELLARAYRALPQGEMLVFSPNHQRSFCYIDDAVETILRLALAPNGLGGTFNVGRMDEEISIAVLAEYILEVIGKPLRVRHGPVTEGSPARRVPDIGAAVAITGFIPSTDLRVGLERTFKWYRDGPFDAAAGTPTVDGLVASVAVPDVEEFEPHLQTAPAIGDGSR